MLGKEKGSAEPLDSVAHQTEMEQFVMEQLIEKQSRQGKVR